MRSLFATRLAAYGILLILSLVILFHILVLMGVIPDTIVWGGNINSKQELFVLETVSIALNLFMIMVALVYLGTIRWRISALILRILFWVMFALFLLNTLGNLVAKNSIETYIFTPLTFLLAVFCFIVAAFGFGKKQL
jgi:hypothetical protein